MTCRRTSRRTSSRSPTDRSSSRPISSTPVRRPAINVGISVSRVGGAAQIKAMRSVAGRLRLDLAQYRELEAFAAFASDLDKTTKAQLDRGARTVEVLKQPQYEPMPVEQQVMIIYAVSNGFLDDIELARMKVWERDFLAFMTKSYAQVGLEIRDKKVMSKEAEEALKTGIAAFKATPAGARRPLPSRGCRCGEVVTRTHTADSWRRDASSKDGSSPLKGRARSRAPWRWSPRRSSSARRIASSPRARTRARSKR